jgi:hypothetical protein
MDVNSESAIINKFISDSDFHDQHGIDFNYDSMSALEIYQKLASITPKWVNALMLARNKFVSLFGLKNLGLLGDIRMLESNLIKEGDRLGIFTLTHLTDNEVVLNDTDKHLSVNLSVRKFYNNGKKRVLITTIVKNHNKFGGLYMVFVKPVHKLIVPAMLSRLASKFGEDHKPLNATL